MASGDRQGLECIVILFRFRCHALLLLSSVMSSAVEAWAQAAIDRGGARPQALPAPRNSLILTMNLKRVQKPDCATLVSTKWLSSPPSENWLRSMLRLSVLCDDRPPKLSVSV